MTNLRSPRSLRKRLHRREKAMIDHLARTIGGRRPDNGGRTLSPVTASGLTVEEQVRKACLPCRVGLATF